MSIALISEQVEPLRAVVKQLQGAGLNVLVNHPPGAEDVVVFCVWATEGPALQTLNAYRVCQGIDISRWAVLLCNCEAVDDRELHELVSLETAAVILGALGDETCDTYHDLRDNQPDLAERLRAIAKAPGRSLQFGDPTSSVANAIALARTNQTSKRPWWKFW